VALERSYHGKTIGAASLSNALALPDAIRMRAPVHLVSTDEVDRLESLLRSGRMAALFVEPVQGEGGIRPVAPAWIATAAQICRETGTLLALDEIQTGLGRCGRIWRSGGDVAPDLLTVGKTLGGGLVPIAAVLYASERVGARASDPVVHASSFAGGALAGAVGRRVVELVEAPGFLKRVREDGEFVRFHLERRLASLEHVEAVRGEGLMMGVEFRDPSVCGHVVLEAAKRKLLVTFCLHDPRVMRVYPPVGCAPEVLEGAIATLVDSVESVPVDGA
jgi:acetylornithine aminotransferase/putrescine aminotransferase